MTGHRGPRDAAFPGFGVPGRAWLASPGTGNFRRAESSITMRPNESMGMLSGRGHCDCRKHRPQASIATPVASPQPPIW